MGWFAIYWLACIPFAARFMYGVWYRDFEKVWNWTHALGGVVIALVMGACGAGLLGPIYIATALADRLDKTLDPHTFARVMGGETREHKVKRLKREKRVREQRTKEIEKEIGIT